MIAGPSAPTGAVLSPAATDIATLPPDLVYDDLATTSGGLSSEEAALRLGRFGPNTIGAAAPTRLFTRLASNFVHVMAILLWVGGAVGFLAGLPQLGVAIWVVNVVNGLFSFWQEYKAEKATEALLELLPTTATVLRDGNAEKVDTASLVPGDVVLIEEGDHISADGRLVEHISLRVDQSTLTGESRLVRKASDPVDSSGITRLELPNLVFAGTTVASGRGKLVVTATGAETEFGRIAHLTQSLTETPSPLQRELRRVSLVVSAVAVSVGAVFFVIAMGLGGMSFARGFVFALGMIVAFVPEGLLPTVTLSLAMGTQRMAARNALVKKLSAVETLGCTTVICTDKTGTLTQNEMTVRSVTVGDTTYQFAGVGYSPEGRVDPEPSDQLRLLLTTAVLASNARLLAPSDLEPERWTVIGDPTEGAILTAAMKAGIDVASLAQDHPRVSEVPFDSVRKRMSVVNRFGGEAVVSAKGAPAEILERCVRWHTTGSGAALGEDERSRIMRSFDAAAAEGLRVLGVARGDAVDHRQQEDLENELEFLGLIAMHDPPRPEVAAAIETCRHAGIRLVMITGDYGVTAEAIGRRIGMMGDGPIRVVNGIDLDRMDDEELHAVLEGEVIFARAAPAQKLRIVATLQDRGEVVAVTGDGVNDAPALKKADIGVAMGLAGTDVAREAADVVLLDDNFASIVAAVEEGRAVYDNIKKFTTYILTSNTPEAVPFVAFALSGGRIPIALDVMRRPPRSLDSHLIDRRLLRRAYLILGPFQAAFVMAAFFAAYRLAGIEGWLDLPSSGPVYASATAMALAAVVATQIGNLFAQRSEHTSLRQIGWTTNRLVWWGVLSELVVIALLVYVPTMQSIFGTAPFPAVGWALLLLGIPVLPIVDGIRKALVRHRRRR